MDMDEATKRIAQLQPFHDKLRAGYDAFDAGAGMKGQALAQLMNNPNVPPEALAQAAQNMGINLDDAQGLADNYAANREYLSNVREAGPGGDYQQYESPGAYAAAIRGGSDFQQSGQTGSEWLADWLEGQGILDEDGYTEDRPDKQGVDEFMDLFQPADQQGRDTPPDWAYDTGAVPPDYNTDPGAGYGGYGGGVTAGANNFGSGGVQGVDPGYESNYQRQQTSGDMSNQELYDTQFSNLLGQQNDFQNQQEQAQAIRNERGNQQQPDFNRDEAFSWYNPEGGGLKTAAAAMAPQQGGADASTWQFAPGVNAGMTNREAFGVVAPLINEQHRGWLNNGFNDPLDPSGGDAVQFASGAHMDPSYYRSVHGPEVSPEYKSALDSFTSALYNRTDLTTPAGGGPTASPGYAPVI